MPNTVGSGEYGLEAVMEGYMLTSTIPASTVQHAGTDRGQTSLSRVSGIVRKEDLERSAAGGVMRYGPTFIPSESDTQDAQGGSTAVFGCLQSMQSPPPSIQSGQPVREATTTNAGLEKQVSALLDGLTLHAAEGVYTMVTHAGHLVFARPAITAASDQQGYQDKDRRTSRSKRIFGEVVQPFTRGAREQGWEMWDVGEMPGKGRST
jgi:hypothetical protein